MALPVSTYMSLVKHWSPSVNSVKKNMLRQAYCANPLTVLLTNLTYDASIHYIIGTYQVRPHLIQRLAENL